MSVSSVMWFALLQVAAASEWEFKAETGAHIGQSTNGVITVATRKGPWEIGWYTDTLDLRYAPSFDKGRAWVAVRAEFAIAGLMYTRWQDGARARDLDLLAFYQGIEGGGVFYLPAGMYIGAEATARVWEFVALPTTERDVPGPRPVLTADAIFGIYHDWTHLYVRAGTDWTDRGFSPHVRAVWTTSLPWLVRPTFALHAGWADNVDEVTATRVGGLNPWVVPLAGAAWAEFLVEDYVAMRLGPEVGQLNEGIGWSTALTADVTWFDGRREVGFAAWGRYEHKGRFIEAALGYAPWLPRPGSIAMVGWFRVGATWGHKLEPRD